MWRIIIENGEVITERAELIYANKTKFNDIETKKQVYKITKDEKLRDELMLNELEMEKTK